MCFWKRIAAAILSNAPLPQSRHQLLSIYINRATVPYTTQNRNQTPDRADPLPRSAAKHAKYRRKRGGIHETLPSRVQKDTRATLASSKKPEGVEEGPLVVPVVVPLVVEVLGAPAWQLLCQVPAVYP